MGHAQRTSYKVTTAPASEPILTADAKTYLNVSTALHNTLIDNLVSAARIHYENYTNTAVITQSITQTWDLTPERAEFELAINPVTAAVVSYKDANGAYQVWSSANYTLDTISPIARIVKISTASWPTTGDFIAKWKVVYDAGYANSAAVPEDVISSILLLVGFLYENREDIPINDTNNYKIRSFMATAFGRRMHLI